MTHFLLYTPDCCTNGCIFPLSAVSINQMCDKSNLGNEYNVNMFSISIPQKYPFILFLISNVLNHFNNPTCHTYC